MEELEKRIEHLEMVIKVIGGSVSSILEAIADEEKMEQLKRTMIGVQQHCENISNSLN